MHTFICMKICVQIYFPCVLRAALMISVSISLQPAFFIVPESKVISRFCMQINVQSHILETHDKELWPCLALCH